ncbi:MAG: carbohydrate ABC transporter permease [Ostreibacterium sp.]
MFKNLTQKQITAIFAYTLILPATLFLVLIVAVPLTETIRLSFTNTGLSSNWHYIGLQNYYSIFTGNFNSVISLTFMWMFASLSLKMILGTLGATLLNVALPGKTVFRILVMPPWIIPIAIGLISWLWLYNGQFGMISNVFQSLGLLDSPYEFLAYKSSAFWACVVADVWIGTPMITIFLLAAMQGVPKDLYEAAWVDGASRWVRFWRITIPQIAPVLGSMCLLSAIWTFNSFEVIWILTNGGPRDSTATMIIDTYKTAISRFKYGEGSARAVVIVLILSLFIGCYYWGLRFIRTKSYKKGGIK